LVKEEQETRKDGEDGGEEYEENSGEN